MFLRSKTLFSAMLMAVSSIVHADSLCGDSQCDVTFMFDGGGSITASEGVTFKLTVGGELQLGEEGLVSLGDEGSVVGMTEAELTGGGALPVLSEFTLDSTGEITLGAGGSFSFVGNAEYPQDSVIDVSGATSVIISAADEETVITLAGIDTVGSVSLTSAGDISYGGGVDGHGGLLFSGGDTDQALSIEAPAISFTGGIERVGNLELIGLNVTVPNVSSVRNLHIDAEGYVTVSSGGFENISVRGRGEIELQHVSESDKSQLPNAFDSGCDTGEPLEAKQSISRATISQSGVTNLTCGAAVISTGDITLSGDNSLSLVTLNPLSEIIEIEPAATEATADISEAKTVSVEDDTNSEADSGGGGGAISLLSALLMLACRKRIS